MQFQPDWPNDKQITALLNFCMKTEKFPSTEVNDAPLERSTFFSLSQLLGPYSVAKLSVS